MIAVLDKSNKVIAFPGGSAPTYTDGILEAPTYDQRTLLNPHDVCIDNDENIYVPQWASGRTYPVKLHRL
jgi:peptidylamidoglycolate lyase